MCQIHHYGDPKEFDHMTDFPTSYLNNNILYDSLMSISLMNNLPENWFNSSCTYWIKCQKLKYWNFTLQTALCHACASGLLPIVQLLSEVSGVDVNQGDKEGNTPLIFAAQAGKSVPFGGKC